MDEKHRRTETPELPHDPGVSAVLLADQEKPTETAEQETTQPGVAPPKKVGFNDIFGELFTPSNLALFGAALLLGLIGLLGGWDRVGAKNTDVPTVNPKQEFKAEPFKLAFQKAYWYTSVNGLPATSPGERALMVTVDMTNTSPRPVILEDVQEVFRTEVSGLITAGQGKVPQIFRASDLLNLRTLQPGLKTRVALIWAQSEATRAPTKLTVSTFKQTYRKSSLDGSMRYFDTTEAAKTTLPVQEFRVP